MPYVGLLGKLEAHYTFVLFLFFIGFPCRLLTLQQLKQLFCSDDGGGCFGGVGGCFGGGALSVRYYKKHAI